MRFDAEKKTFEDPGKFGKIALIVGIVGVVVSLAGLFINREQFFFSWLVSFAFWMSLGLGALFFVMIHHITGAVWSVVVRRIAESVMMTLPVMAIFVIPVFIGMSDLYEWKRIICDGHATAQDHVERVSFIPAAHAETGADAHTVDAGKSHHAEVDPNPEAHGMDAAHGGDHETMAAHGEGHDDHGHAAHMALIREKAGYLNTPFFIARTVIYFIAWSLLGFMLWKTSVRQDSEGFDPAQKKRFRTISAPGIIVFAMTTTFAAFDWLMSLMPAWYSTIYGLYYFAGGIMGIMALLSIITVLLNKKGVLKETITVEHFHDMGKLLFAFMVVWGYFAFSQYLLIWYANIPEETVFYHQRWVGDWKAVSVVLAVLGFVVPFILVMSRSAKRNIGILMFWGFYLLVFHWVDLYWNVMPIHKPESAVPSWLDLTTMVGIGGVFLWAFWSRFTKQAAIPVNDPKLPNSAEFINPY